MELFYANVQFIGGTNATFRVLFAPAGSDGATIHQFFKIVLATGWELRYIIPCALAHP